MAIYKIRFIDSHGRKLITTENYNNEEDLFLTYAKKGFTVIDFKKSNKTSIFSEKFKTNFKLSQQIQFIKQLSALMNASFTIKDALNLLINEKNNTKINIFLRKLITDLNSGFSFSKSFENQNTNFPKIFIPLFSAGEKTGKMKFILNKLDVYLSQKENLINKLRLAFTYPIIVTIVAIFIIIFLMVYVIPQVIVVFNDSGQTLPLLTKIFLFFFESLKLIFPYFCLAALSTILVFFFFFNRNEKFKFYVHKLLTKLPFFGNFLIKIDSATFASTLAISHGSGISILESLDYAIDSVQNLQIKEQIKLIKEDVKKGVKLSKSLSNFHHSPQILFHMIKSGEVSGSLEEMLLKASKMLESEVEQDALKFASILEPLLILIMGGFVLVTVLAVLLPIIKINQLVVN